MNKTELVSYLGDYLQNGLFDDSSKNGLQVDTTKIEIKKIGYGVDATSYVFDRAIEEGVDMILTHHGLFWGSEQVLVGPHFERVSKLLHNNISLYACHLPLDAHKEVGNNIGMVKAFQNMFGLAHDSKIESFGNYHGKEIGYGLRFAKKVHISNLVTPYAEHMQLKKRLYNFGEKEYIESIAFVSGGGGSALMEAKTSGFDVFVTGEMVHHEICLAKEMKQSILLGGHRETEKIGPKLLAYHLKEKFGIEIIFLDLTY